jgi:hypothetical protein
LLDGFVRRNWKAGLAPVLRDPSYIEDWHPVGLVVDIEVDRVAVGRAVSAAKSMDEVAPDAVRGLDRSPLRSLAGLVLVAKVSGMVDGDSQFSRGDEMIEQFVGSLKFPTSHATHDGPRSGDSTCPAPAIGEAEVLMQTSEAMIALVR